MADFTGFYFDNIHSSTYGLIRTSNGDRYKEGLIPEFDDSEIELVGRDGSLYEGRQFKKTEFSIPVAFDNISEKQFRDLRNWLGSDELKEFRFDERPYKAYWAKLSSRPELEYLCFLRDKEDGLPGEQERVYKGEGELQFIAYEPFGYCSDNSYYFTENGRINDARGINWQTLNTYVPFVILDDNVNEWAEVSGLKNTTQLEGYNVFSAAAVKGEAYEYKAYLYNPGDFKADFQMFISLGGTEEKYEDYKITLDISQTEGEQQFFQFSIKGLSGADKILLNTKNHSLTVYHKNGEKTSKSLRYDLVKSTDWPSIPIGDSTIKIQCGLNTLTPEIKYSYKYY